MTIEDLTRKLETANVDGGIYFVASLKRWGIRWGTMNIGSGETLLEAMEQAGKSIEAGKVGPYRLTGL